MYTLSFKEWLFIVEANKPMHSILTPNPNKKNDPNFDYLNVVGAGTYDAKPLLLKLGFRYSFPYKTYSMPRFVFKKLTQQEKQQLKDAGVDISPFEEEAHQPDNRQKFLGTKTEVSVDQHIKQELETIKDLATSGEQNEKINAILDNIIEEIANLTDEAKKSDIIKNFLLMSSKLYRYSARNQWLIFAQNPRSTDVQSMTNWAKVGRKLKLDAEKNRMIIFAPVGVRLVTVKDERTGEEKKVPVGTPTRFKISYVYDISDTEPIPGAKVTYTPGSWRQDSNEPVEELGGIVNALLKFTEENNIPIKYEKMDFSMGGYATTHGIAINDVYDGINKASTLVHEIAHKLLHFGADRDKYARDEKEHDAESIAYVFLKHFGFESKDSPVYLALWGADKTKIVARQKKVREIVSQLIKAVEKYYKEADYSNHDEIEEV